MASAETIPKTVPTSSKPNTPPQTSTQSVGPIISPHHIQQLLEILSRAVPSKEESKQESKPAETGVDNENEKGPKARASKLEFKIVNETWCKSAYKYIIAESQECPTKEDDKWVEYIFVIRKKFDKENKYYTEYVDVKSEGLQDILCEILNDVNGISLRKDKPSVHPALLLTYLPQLEAYQTVHSTYTSIQHLNLLTQYLTDHYDATLKRFNALLKEGKIIFDLLWILFQPNTLVYATCPSSDQPRCLKLDFGQMEQSPQGECFFKLDCRYLDYDGKVFGEVEISLALAQFRSAKKINTLDVFPLQYHTQAEKLKDALTARGNLMMNEEEDNPSWQSFLIDLDLAIKESREKPSGAPNKTGTRAFMAIGALYGEKHFFIHDLKSFSWVLFWICIHYNGPNKESRVVPKFEKWNYEEMEELAMLKKGMIDNEGDFVKKMEENFTLYYQPLIPWVN